MSIDGYHKNEEGSTSLEPDMKFGTLSKSGPGQFRVFHSMHSSTKTYGHEVGLSCAFRQWRAKSHCSLIHGYAIAVRFEFKAAHLDETNWVVDFGGLKSLKSWLEDTFDHTLLVAQDDPHLATLQDLDTKGIAKVVVVDAVGCEKFAQLIFNRADAWLEEQGYKPRVHLALVEVKEHGANSAIYYRSDVTGHL